MIEILSSGWFDLQCFQIFTVEMPGKVSGIARLVLFTACRMPRVFTIVEATDGLSSSNFVIAVSFGLGVPYCMEFCCRKLCSNFVEVVGQLRLFSRSSLFVPLIPNLFLNTTSCSLEKFLTSSFRFSSLGIMSGNRPFVVRERMLRRR